VIIDAKLKTGKKGQENRADWEKFIKEAEVHIGL